VSRHRRQEHDPSEPQKALVRQQGVAEVAQERGVHIHGIRTVLGPRSEHLEVAEHVPQHEPEEYGPRQRHHDLLADGGSIESRHATHFDSGRSFDPKDD